MSAIADWLLTPERVAVHRPTATAVVADLHLGYQQARRQCGDAIPVVDAQSVFGPLQNALAQSQAKRLIVAGDLFEKAFDSFLWRQFQMRLFAMGVQFVGLIPGNHDRGLEEIPSDLPLHKAGHLLDGWHVLHGDGILPETPAVFGHFHPCIMYRGRKVPCYLFAADRLVLPAYSLDAAGVNVSSNRRWRGFSCLAIVDGKVINCGLVGDR
jgi:putative SbcD/Mre11-related phosphoesterase